MGDDDTAKMLKADQGWRTLHQIPQAPLGGLTFEEYQRQQLGTDEAPPLRERAEAIAKAPWAYAAADISTAIEELLAALPEEAPMDYKDALHVVKYPQLNDPAAVDEAFATLNELDPGVKTAQREHRIWAAIWIGGVVLAVLYGLH